MAKSIEWVRAYARIVDGTPASCPNCRGSTVRLLLVARKDTRMGYGFIWCETCLEGMHISRLGVPEGFEFIPFERADVEVRLPEGIRFVER